MTTARTRPRTSAYGRLVIALTILGLALPAAPGPAPALRSGPSVRPTPARAAKASARRARVARGAAALALQRPARRPTADPQRPIRPPGPGPRAPDDSEESDELPDAPDDPIVVASRRVPLGARRLEARPSRPSRSAGPRRATIRPSPVRPPIDLPTRLCRLTC